MSDTRAGSNGAITRRPLLLILGVTAVGQLSFAAVPPVLPELAVAFDVSRSAIGLVHGMVAFAGIFVAAYMGYLLDRFGRRRVVRWSLLLFGAAGTACFFAADENIFFKHQLRNIFKTNGSFV